MVSWTAKHQRELQSQKRARIDRYLKAPVWFLIGVVVTLFLQNWLVRVLPGPRPVVTLQGTRFTSGSAQGCIFLRMDFATGETLDYIQMRVGFPWNIQSSQVGTDYEGVLSEGKNLRMDSFGRYRNALGECEVIALALNKDENISASSMSNELLIRTSKFPGKAYLVAVVAADENRMKTNLTTPNFEGEYEYNKLGIPVRKKLGFKYLGITDVK